MESKIYLARDGKTYSNVTRNVGGGVVDVIAFALRIALWKLKTPQTRNTIILDEPFKHLRGKKEQQRSGLLLRELSNKLGIQFIIITPKNSVIEENSDKIFVIGKSGRRSIIEEEIENEMKMERI